MKKIKFNEKTDGKTIIVKCSNCKIKQHILIPDVEKNPSLLIKLFDDNIKENVVFIIRCCHCGNQIICDL